MSFTLSKKLEERSAGLFSTFMDWPSCSSNRRCSRESFRRHHHANIHVEVAAAAVRIRQPFALLAEDLAGLRAFGNFEIVFALAAWEF